MIISRTPFRISFFGGGTDYPNWFQKNGGAVINCTINKYSYLFVRYLPPFFKYNYKIRYYKKEEILNIDQIRHPTIREVLRYFKLQNKKLDITHTSDLPAQSGLGSSSSLTVGLIHAISTLENIFLTKKELAYKAINIEYDILKENIGCQDQVISSFGGLNYINFEKNRNILVEKIFLNNSALEDFQESLLLIFTNLQRNANTIAKKQIQNIENNKSYKYLNEMNQLTDYAKNEIFSKKNINLRDLGSALNEQWKIKKKLANNITNDKINEVYNYGLKNGALGGKLLGAGNGGFILFVVNKKEKKRLIEKFKNLINVPIKIDSTGSQIVYYKK
jgi:D-glycero-alpha-D-manno-heptose-7-phosphate kinase